MMGNGIRVGVGLFAVLVVLILDQVTKLMVLRYVEEGETVDVLPFFNILRVWNEGISFGLFSDMDAVTVRWIIVGGALLITVFLLYWLMVSRRLFLSVGLGMMIGGAVGNIVDRLAWGAVIDFIHVFWGSWSWYIFNVADIGVTVGVAFMVLDGFFDKGEEEAREG
jgi:signal peptidase II